MRSPVAWFATGLLIVLTAAAITAPVIVIGESRGAGGAYALDDADRAAFRHWFTYLADTQFERRTDDVIDCASLVRYAYREALRPHTPEWFRRTRLPQAASFPDVRQSPPMRDGAWLLFRISPAVAGQPARYAEFADAATLVRYNARPRGRDARTAQPGDLLFFHQDGAASPDHLMVMIGASRFDRERRDWVVYHTGPDGGSAGEVRKVSLADLEQHPAPRWRPIAANPAFVGVFRLTILDTEGAASR